MKAVHGRMMIKFRFLGVAVPLIAALPCMAFAQLDLVERNQKAAVKGLADQNSIMEWLPASRTWRIATGATADWRKAMEHRYRLHEMVEAAAKLAHSEVGAAYERNVLPSLTTGVASAVASCAAHATSLEPFSVVFIIGGDGSVTAAVLNRPMYKCAVEHANIPSKVATPPHAPWLVSANIRR